MDENLENEVKNENKKNELQIGFFKKIWFSITNIKKYDNMSKSGLKSAFKYLAGIIAIITLVLSIIATWNVVKFVDDSCDYIQNNVSNVVFKNYELSSEESFILDSDEIINLFGYTIVIDTETSKEDATNTYSSLESNYDIVVLLKNEFLLIDNDTNETTEYEYESSLETLGLEIDTDTEYEIQDVIDYINNNVSVVSYICNYFILYFITYFVAFVACAIIVAVIGYIIKSILKIKMTKHELGEYAIYSLTTSTIVFLLYLFINYFTNFVIQYFEIVIIIISSIYMFLAIKNKPENVNEIEGTIIETESNDEKVDDTNDMKNKSISNDDEKLKDKKDEEEKSDNQNDEK